MSLSHIIIGLLFTALGLVLWRYNRQSISEALRKRDMNNQVDAIVRNQKANQKKHEREQKRNNMRDRSVDPDDPWNGVRDS